MLFTSADKRQAAQVKERAAKAQGVAFDCSRHIDDVSDDELKAMTVEAIALLDGVTVKAQTIRNRLYDGWDLRKAAKLARQKPAPKLSKEKMKAWNSM